MSGNPDAVEWGGVDYYHCYYNGSMWWWEGGNSAFAQWDAGDANPNNGCLDVYFNVSSASLTNVRVVLTWLNRGTWTWIHRNDTYPIGTDLDLYVYKPDGSSQATSLSYYDGVEVVDFDPVVAGNYRACIQGYAFRDTSSKLNIGLGVHWQ